MKPRPLSPFSRRFPLCCAAVALALLSACAGPGKLVDALPLPESVDLAAQTPDRVNATAADYRANDCATLALFLPVMRQGQRTSWGFRHTVYGWHVDAIEEVQQEKGCAEPGLHAGAKPASRLGTLNVQLDSVTPGVAHALGLHPAHGALVGQAAQGSAAEQAGLRAGDVIIEIAGQHVQSPAELTSIVGLLAPGARVPLRVRRDASVTELSIEIAARPVSVAQSSGTIRR